MPEVLGTSKSIYGFDPRSIPGCCLWLDGADSNATASITTGTWVDKSTFGSNATSNAGATAFSMGSIGGLRAVTFPGGSATQMQSTVSLTVSATQGFSVFFVAKWTAATTDRQRFYSTGSAIDYELMTSNAAIPTYGGTYANGTYLYGIVLPSNTPFVYSAVFTSTATNGFGHWLNGVSGGTATVTGTGTTSSMAIGNWVYGPATAYAFIGQMGEFIVYNTALTTDQRHAVEGYLAWKWRPAPIMAPTDITGCVLWLDASDATKITTTGSQVTAWRDKSALNKTVTVTSATTPYVTYCNSATTGYPGPCVLTTSNCGVYATAVDIRRYTGTYSNAHIFILYQYTPWTYGTTSNGVISYLFGNGDVTQSMNQSYIGAGYQANILADGFGTIGNYQAVSDSKRKLYEYTTAYFSATSNTTYVWLNGVAQTQFYSANSSNRGTPDANLAFGGSISTSPAGQNIGFHEMIVFSNKLSDYDRYRVEYYLSNKWAPLVSSEIGICVPSTPLLPLSHPFALVKPHTRYFNPVDICGCQLWLDAGDGTTLFSDTGGTTPATISGQIAYWRNKAGSSYNYTQATKGYRPIYTSDGTVTFSNGQAMINTDAWSGNGASTDIFCVSTPWAQSQYSDWRTLLRGSNAGHRAIIATTGYGNGTTSLGLWNGAFSQFGSLTLTGVKNLLFVTTLPSFASSAELNGDSALSSSSGNQNSDAYPFYCLGAYQGAPTPSQAWGAINELIIFSRNLTTSERQQVEGYLAWKWNVTLVVTIPKHPFYTFPSSSRVPFLPTDISGCQMWVDASRDTTSVNGYVSEIPDYSGSGLASSSFLPIPGGTNAFYTTAGTANYLGSTVTGPLYTISNQIQLCNSYQNGMSVYSFGNNVAMTMSTTVWGTSFTQFAVVKSSTGRWRCSYNYGGSNLADIDTLQSNTNGYIMKMGSYQAKDTGIAASNSVFTGRGNGTTGWNLVVIGYAAGATAGSNYSINGTAYTASTTGSTAAQSAAITAAGQMVLNGYYDGSLYRAADTATFLAEVIHYNGNLSAADRQIVEGYLMNKWRI
jgi:hypothetical protein